MKPPTPENEPARLAALERYRILDTPREEEFDGITRLIAHVCEVPFAVVNLIAEGRQWFKSEIGFGVRETPLESSFCAHAILQRGLFIVPDTTEDERFACNPLVTGEPELRFYAGALLETEDGFPLGTLCVLDTEPRELDEHQKDALEVLAAQVMKLLALRRELASKDALTRELDAALQARARLLAVVSHDLRTPLGTVLMTADHLSELAEDPDRRRAAERLRRAAVGMQRLVEDLLDFESMNRGQLSMSLEEVDLNEMLDDLVRSFEVQAGAAKIQLHSRCAASAIVPCDPQRIQQAIGNLVANALEMTPEGGEVGIECEIEPDAASIRVRDTGPGFDPELGSQLFEPFWRSDTRAGRGAGLGLSIAQSIVEAHGGTIEASSAEGAGATFTVRLPRA